jgi:hypothetical protein
MEQPQQQAAAEPSSLASSEQLPAQPQPQQPQQQQQQQPDGSLPSPRAQQPPLLRREDSKVLKLKGL